MNIAIMEDDLTDLKLLLSFIDHFFSIHNESFSAKVYNDPDELLKNINHIDLVFLDIENSKKVNGIEIGVKAREKNKDLLIVFISNYSQYLIDGYKAQANRYFIKPMKQCEFNVELAALLKNHLISNAGFMDEKLSYQKIFYKDIVYIEFVCRKTYLHLSTTSKILHAPYPLRYWKEKVPEDVFSQPYKSLLVNLKYVSDFSKNEVILSTNESLPLSRHYKSAFEIQFLDYVNRSL